MATSNTADAMVSITIPAAYVEEFRCALVEEIKTSAGWFQDSHAEMLTREDRNTVDRDGAARELRRDAEVFLQLSDANGDTTVAGTSSLSHVIDQMARKWATELSTELDFGPSNFRPAPGLLERLNWCTEQAAAIGKVA